MMPLASAHPRTVAKMMHNPRIRPAPRRMVRGVRTSAPPATSHSGRRTESGLSHVSGTNVNGAKAMANCTLLEALIRPEEMKTPARSRRIANAPASRSP